MSRLKNAKILIVDDHRNMRKVWRNLLLGFGAQRIYDAEGAIDTLDLLSNLDVDLVILDYHLDDLTGAELASILRKNTESPAPLVPILGCTSDQRSEVIMNFINSGVDEVVGKPLSPPKVWHKIALIVNHRRSFVRTSTYTGPDRRRLPFKNLGTNERRLGNGLAAVDEDACLLDP